MSLLRRVGWPLYRLSRVSIILLLGFIWFVNLEHSNESSAGFLKSLQQETLKTIRSQNSSLQQETLKNVHSDNSSFFVLKSANSALPLKDNLQKPEGVADEGTIDIFEKERPMEENAVAQRLRIRREKVLDVCRSKKIHHCHTKTVMTHRMFFFHRYDTSVCTMAKSGSSTWRAHLRLVNKGPPFKVPIDKDKIRAAFLKRLIEAIVKDVNSSSLIITVRHPLTRLVSAFRNKYNDGKVMDPHAPHSEKRVHKRVAGSYWFERFHQFWLPALFANNMVPPDTHLKTGMKAPIDPGVLYSEKQYERLYYVLKPKVTFSQFLKYVLKTYQEGTPDAHWKLYHDDCCPCYFDYDYITKIETLSEDLKYIFKKLGIPANPKISKNKRRRSVHQIYSYLSYYRRVPATLKREIYQYIKYDMDLFGYELPKNFLI
ncbi:carbohydrate sulfotransferase 11-like [Palaemon carinicauda]|uniref:carbohydrate sulfotransferase 11-like n=1 Tax=Palaemon carinicauda TaxID=392227 RepID=UPI0035B6A84B